jgi:carboxymethylenebutenolidase
MKQELLNLYSDDQHGSLDRRELLQKLAVVAGGASAAAVMLPSLENAYAALQVVPKEDPRLKTGYIKYPVEGGEIRAYSAQPKEGGKRPGMIVIHENRGLNAHIEDVARRIALEGYITIAPDALSPFGGTPENPEEARPLFQKLDSKANIANFTAAVQYLKTNPLSTGKVGCTGFCWGGGVTNQVAVNSPDLAVAVPFYGMQPAPEDVPRIKAAMLIHYAGKDERINAGIAAFETALKKASIQYRLYLYEGAEHAFFNDSNPTRYHPEAAKLAWQRTIDFLKEKLKT